MHHLEETIQEVRKVAFLGGVYSNYLALEAAIKLAQRQGVDAIWALGDFGAFGPHPDRTIELLKQYSIPAIQGNYEESLSNQAEDCACGYTDPRDNYYAQISYDYTDANTSTIYKDWMGTLPKHARLRLGTQELYLCHGSPRKVNEFLFQSTTPVPFVERMLHQLKSDIIVCTHTGIHWNRLHQPGRGVVNVGALGRPANDGSSEVWLTVMEAKRDGEIVIQHLPVEYKHQRLAEEMKAEGLPQEFVDTILHGFWTTCLEILPAKERALGKY